MKTLTLVLTGAIVIFLFQSCIGTKPERETIVREKCKEYLKDKYNKQFEILNYKQYFHGGHWRYETDIEAFPSDNQLLTFWLKYDAKGKAVKSDEYKRAFWENQIEEELKSIIADEYTVLDFDARLTKNGSIVFSNSDLEFYPTYQELISNVELPVLLLSIHIAGVPRSEDGSLDCFIKLSEVLAKKAFVKNEFKVYFYDKAVIDNNKNSLSEKSSHPDESLCTKQLFFKFSNKIKVPKNEDISGLIVEYRKDSLFKNNKVLFEQGEKVRIEGDTEKALDIYLQIVSNVSEYRYNTYAPAEAAYSVESAFYAAEILEKQNKHKQAMELYQGIVRRMEYEEARLNLSDFYKKAKQKIEEEKE